MNFKSLTLIFCFATALIACAEDKNANIELSGINFKNVGIEEFSINGYSGHGIDAHGGGGAFVCCVTIPRKWQVGMKVEVQWTDDTWGVDIRKKRIVDVPRYTEKDVGIFAVHFYPDDTVKVLVTSIVIGHPNYPYPEPN